MKIEKDDESVLTLKITATREEWHRLCDGLRARKRSNEERAAIAELVNGILRALGTKPQTIADLLTKPAKREPKPIARPDDLTYLNQPKPGA